MPGGRQGPQALHHSKVKKFKMKHKTAQQQDCARRICRSVPGCEGGKGKGEDAGTEGTPPPPPTCPICLEGFEENDDAILLECSHLFHEKCATVWSATRPYAGCAMCRDGALPEPGPEQELFDFLNSEFCDADNLWSHIDRARESEPRVVATDNELLYHIERATDPDSLDATFGMAIKDLSVRALRVEVMKQEGQLRCMAKFAHLHATHLAQIDGSGDNGEEGVDDEAHRSRIHTLRHVSDTIDAIDTNAIFSFCNYSRNEFRLDTECSDDEYALLTSCSKRVIEDCLVLLSLVKLYDDDEYPLSVERGATRRSRPVSHHGRFILYILINCLARNPIRHALATTEQMRDIMTNPVCAIIIIETAMALARTIALNESVTTAFDLLMTRILGSPDPPRRALCAHLSNPAFAAIVSMRSTHVQPHDQRAFPHDMFSPAVRRDPFYRLVLHNTYGIEHAMNACLDEAERNEEGANDAFLSSLP